MECPFCEMCSGKPESEIGRLQTDQRIRADLQRKMPASTARAHAASEKLIAIMRDIPSGLPQLDGSLRIENATRALAAARYEMMNAHSQLTEFLARGVVPGDFRTGRPRLASRRAGSATRRHLRRVHRCGISNGYAFSLRSPFVFNFRFGEPPRWEAWRCCRAQRARGSRKRCPRFPPRATMRAVRRYNIPIPTSLRWTNVSNVTSSATL